MRNPYILRTALPSMSLECRADWHDRATFSAGIPFVFDRVLIADRSAAMMGNAFMSNYRTASGAMDLPGSPYWWNALKNNVVGSAGVNSDEVAKGIKDGNPIVTFISRQGLRRRLIKDDYESLVGELRRLEREHGYEVHIMQMEDLLPAQEVHLLAKSSVRPLLCDIPRMIR